MVAGHVRRCSSSARSTCSACSATTRSRSASRSCRSTLVMGTLSLALLRAADHALRRAARRCSPGSALIAAGLLLFAQAPVDGDYVTDVLPAMVAARRRRRPRVPGADDARDVGRDARATPAWPPAWSTRREQVGGALGLAVLATLSTTRTDDLLAAGDSHARGADRRLPPRLPDRRRPGRRRDRGRADRARAGPAPDPPGASRRRATPARAISETA